MSRMFVPLRVVVAALLLFFSAVSIQAQERFAMAVGSHNILVVFDSKGDRKAELPLPSISQTVTADNVSFQVSSGRDANERLTAIIAPNPAQPQSLHFTVLNKTIDADKSAVVTLTFSRSLNSVKVDPGYIGEVQVNSRRIGHD